MDVQALPRTIGTIATIPTMRHRLLPKSTKLETTGDPQGHFLWDCVKVGTVPQFIPLVIAFVSRDFLTRILLSSF